MIGFLCFPHLSKLFKHFYFYTTISSLSKICSNPKHLRVKCDSHRILSKLSIHLQHEHSNMAYDIAIDLTFFWKHTNCFILTSHKYKNRTEWTRSFHTYISKKFMVFKEKGFINYNFLKNYFFDHQILFPLANDSIYPRPYTFEIWNFEQIFSNFFCVII